MHRQYLSSDGSTVTVRKKCLGVLQCPHPECRFVHRPKVLTKEQREVRKASRSSQKPNSAVPSKSADQSEDEMCLIHHCVLEHVSCDVSIIMQEKGGEITISNLGHHLHRAPIPLRATQEALDHLEAVVSTASASKPKDLLHETELRMPISAKYRVFRKLSYLRELRRKIIHRNKSPNNIGQLAAMEEILGFCFIRSSSIRSVDGHISIQIPFVQQHCQDIVSSMQTDSVHGIITDDHFSDINVTITSAYCPVLQRTVPLLMSILFGTKTEHYQRHFEALLQSLPYNNWADFDKNFPGMTCDFAEGQRLGFQAAVVKHFGITADQFIPERHFGFCAVHWERSVVRIRRNGAIIPPTKEWEFYQRAMALTSSTLSASELEESIDQLVKSFPKIRNWIDFYLQEDRARIHFPAFATAERKSTISKDTNAQESLGGDFKGFVKRVLRVCSIVQGVTAIVRYQDSFFADFDFAAQGGILRYHDSRKDNPSERTRSSRVSAFKKKTAAAKTLLSFHNRFLPDKPVVNAKYSNDGRAPDTTKLLLSVKSTRNVGRPPGSRNRLPSLLSIGDIDWKTFGIPWRGMAASIGCFTFTDSCPLDTTLMAWFLISRLAGATLPSTTAGTKAGQTLLRVMEEVRATHYDKARELWCTEVMGLAADSHHNLTMSLEKIFLDRLPSLTRIEMSRSSHCNRPGCPSRSDTLVKTAVTMTTTDRISQDTFDFSWRTQFDTTCTVPVDISEGVSEQVKMMTLLDDNGELQTWNSCAGNRELDEPLAVTTYPYLLVLDCFQASFDKNAGAPQTPAESLNLDGVAYKRVALLYGDGKHFCCGVFFAGNVFLYDGLVHGKGPLIRQFTLKELKHPEGYKIVHVWYIREHQDTNPPISTSGSHASSAVSVREHQNIDPLDAATGSVAPPTACIRRNSITDSGLLDFESSTAPSVGLSTNYNAFVSGYGSLKPPSRSNNTKAGHGVPRRIQTRRSAAAAQEIAKSDNSKPRYAKTRHPVGLVVCPVNQKGKRPLCGSCNSELERDSLRFIFTAVSGDDFQKRTDSVSYHFTRNCLNGLPTDCHSEAWNALSSV